MFVRNILKRILGVITCKFYSINKYGSNVYIGLHSSIKGEKGYFSLGSDVIIRPYASFLLLTKQSRIIIGNNITLNHHIQVNCASFIEIKDGVNIAPYVFIGDHNHRFDDVTKPIKDQGIADVGRVFIDEGTWIGTKVSIIGNVKIGKHCVVGANSVVTKDIPDYSVAAGVPCRVIKRYNFETCQWEKVNN